MSEYVGVASSGPSAAFFDLDRTLISGSSAFTLAIAGRSAGLIPNQEFVRDTFGALMFKLRGASDGTTDEIRDRVLGFVKGKRQDDLVKLNERVLPTLLGKIRPEARRLLDLHRDGGRPPASSRRETCSTGGIRREAAVSARGSPTISTSCPLSLVTTSQPPATQRCWMSAWRFCGRQS